MEETARNKAQLPLSATLNPGGLRQCKNDDRRYGTRYCATPHRRKGRKDTASFLEAVQPAAVDANPVARTQIGDIGLRQSFIGTVVIAHGYAKCLVRAA